jgi:hypothetical protein
VLNERLETPTPQHGTSNEPLPNVAEILGHDHGAWVSGTGEAESSMVRFQRQASTPGEFVPYARQLQGRRAN